MVKVTSEKEHFEYMQYPTCKALGMDMIHMIDHVWFPVTTYHFLNKGECETIGIVKTYDDITHELEYYIGVAGGKNMVADINLIVATGSKISKIYDWDNIHTVLKMRDKA